MREWTIESAKDFIKKNKQKGLKYWSAYDFLKRSGIITEIDKTNKVSFKKQGEIK